MTEQGLRPAALFALRAVFEAEMLIYGNAYDSSDLYPQKARSSCGRDPRSRRWAAATQRPRSCYAMWRALLLRLQGFIKKTWDVELQVGWNDENFIQTDGAKLEASASVWQGSTNTLSYLEILLDQTSSSSSSVTVP